MTAASVGISRDRMSAIVQAHGVERRYHGTVPDCGLVLYAEQVENLVGVTAQPSAKRRAEMRTGVRPGFYGPAWKCV
jgi:hypothetical protein